MRKNISIITIMAIIFAGCASDKAYFEYVDAQRKMFEAGPPTLITLADGTKIADPRGIPTLAPPKSSWQQWGIPLISILLGTAAQVYMAHENGKTSRAWTDAVIAGIGGGAGYVVNSYNQSHGESSMTTGPTDMKSNDGYNYDVSGTFIQGDGNSDMIGGDYAPQTDNSDNSVVYPPNVVQVPGETIVVRPEIVTVAGPVQVVEPYVVPPFVVPTQVVQCP